MKRFLFDTWYGAFVVWSGTSALFLAILCLERFVNFRLPGGAWSGLSLLASTMLSGILFFIAWIVSLVKRRWGRAIVQTVLGIATAAGVLWAFGWLCLYALFGPSEDNFADNLTIPPEIEKDILVPGSGHEGDGFSTTDVYDDDFARGVFKGLRRAGCDDPTVTCDLAGLAELVHNRRDELMQYLARHPGWWLHEEHGNLCATRRLRVKGVWNHSLHGYYSGNSHMEKIDAALLDDLRKNGAEQVQLKLQKNFEAHQKSTYYQTRTTIGFPYSPFGRICGAEHPPKGSIRAGLGRGNLDSYESCERFGDKDFCVEVFEQSTARERRITNAALAFLKDEFAELKLPEDAVIRGPEEFVLRNGMQPGIYNLMLRLNPGESGGTYLKAFEVTQGTRLSESRLFGRSNERIGWSSDPQEKFLYENEFTIYEGDWGKPYAARIEVWFRPDSGKKERKLSERVCKIEGWQR